MARGKCKQSGCKQKATNTWALVGLCDEHYKEIKTETYQYYSVSSGMFHISYEDRICFAAIAHLIPWRRKVK